MCQNKLHAITHEKVIAKQNYQRHVYQFVEENDIEYNTPGNRYYFTENSRDSFYRFVK